MKRKLRSTLLVLCLVFTILPATATTVFASPDNVAKIVETSTEHTTLP